MSDTKGFGRKLPAVVQHEHSSFETGDQQDLCTGAFLVKLDRQFDSGHSWHLDIRQEHKIIRSNPRAFSSACFPSLAAITL
jgi:hypothetical protein